MQQRRIALADKHLNLCTSHWACLSPSDHASSSACQTGCAATVAASPAASRGAPRSSRSWRPRRWSSRTQRRAMTGRSVRRGPSKCMCFVVPNKSQGIQGCCAAMNGYGKVFLCLCTVCVGFTRALCVLLFTR